LTSEHNEEIELETGCEFESIDFDLHQIVESTVNWASSPISPNPEPTNLTPPSIESSPLQKLKAFVMPASQNTLEQRCDESRRRIYTRRIPHIYTLSLNVT